MGSRETDYSQHSHQHGTVMPSKNIILVSSPGLAATRTRRAGTEKNYNLWAGGSATLVTPDTNNGDVILAELECVPSVVKYKVQSDNTSRPRASKRKVEEDMLDPEEDAKRKMRRNRNRLAAAKCRQKRLDQISELQVEVTNWEEPRSDGPAEPEHSGASDLTVTSLPSVTQPVLVFTHLYMIMYYYHYLLWLPAKLGVLYKIKCN